MKTMKSIFYEKYGSPEVLSLGRTNVPEPGESQVLIKVQSSSVTAADWHLRKADPFMTRLVNGMFKPKNKVLGQEFAGEVIKTGSDVYNLKNGDLVYGSTGLKVGAYSEYIVIDADSVIGKVPDNMDAELMSTVPIGAMTALFFLKQAELKTGHKVLINGASGSVGTYAVQISKTFGASVTGVSSTANLKMVQQLGADAVIDYRETDFTNSDAKFDIIFDTVGSLKFSHVKNNLTANGYFISTAFSPGLLLEMMRNKSRNGRRVFTGVTKESKELLDEITEMVRNQQIRPVIDRKYTMEEIREAHSYVESGRKKGNVLLTINGEQNDA